MPKRHLCISAAGEKQRRNLGPGVGERVFQCDVAHRLRIGHSDPIVIRIAEPHLEARKPSTQRNELAGQGGDGQAAAPNMVRLFRYRAMAPRSCRYVSNGLDSLT
jgi:hypothetical protein